MSIKHEHTLKMAEDAVSQHPGMCCWLGGCSLVALPAGCGEKIQRCGPGERVSAEWERAWLPGISVSGRCPTRDSLAGAKIEEHMCVFVSQALSACHSKDFLSCLTWRKKKVIAIITKGRFVFTVMLRLTGWVPNGCICGQAEVFNALQKSLEQSKVFYDKSLYWSRLDLCLLCTCKYKQLSPRLETTVVQKLAFYN